MKDTAVIIGSIIAAFSFIGTCVVAVVGKLLKDKGMEISNQLEIQHLKEECKAIKENVKEVRDRFDKYVESN